MTATAPQLVFEPGAHKYTLDGVALPSVTTVLKGVGLIDYSMIPQDVLLKASRRGTAVHQALEYFDREELDEMSVAPEFGTRSHASLPPQPERRVSACMKRAQTVPTIKRLTRAGSSVSARSRAN